MYPFSALEQTEDRRSHPGNQRLSVVPARAVTDPNLSDGAFRTLAAIGIFGDRNGWCYPSYSTLAKMRGVTKQAISKHVAELVERGYLNVYYRHDKTTGAQQTSMLQIRFDYEPDDDDSETRTPRQRYVDPPSTSEVDPPSTSEVDPPSTSEVDAINLTPQYLTSQVNGGVKPRQLDVDGAQPPPPSPARVENVENSADVYLRRAEALYRRLRPSHLIIPRTRWYEDALQVLNGVLERHRYDLDAAARELRPYVEAADRRGLAPTNLCWLTEWAASGRIPAPTSRKAAVPATATHHANGDVEAKQRMFEKLLEFLSREMAEHIVFSDGYDLARVERCLPLWDLLKRRDLATDENFRRLVSAESIPVEEFRRRLESGEPVYPEWEGRYGRQRSRSDA